MCKLSTVKKGCIDYCNHMIKTNEEIVSGKRKAIKVIKFLDDHFTINDQLYCLDKLEVMSISNTPADKMLDNGLRLYYQSGSDLFISCVDVDYYSEMAIDEILDVRK